MRFREFLKARLVTIGLECLATASICVIAAVCGCPVDAVILIGIVPVAATAIALAIEYTRNKRFYSSISELSTLLDRSYQLHSLLDEPEMSEHRIVYDALRRMGTCCADEVSKANAHAIENRSYVEGWIHGVKTPLAACELIAERTDEPERSQLRRELNRIDRQVERALWYARSDSTNLDYSIRRLSLAKLANDVCKSNARFLIENGCTPIIDIDPKTCVLSDEKQLAFVMTQAVENSAKYGATHIRFSATDNSSDANSQQIVLSIADDGQGIPASDINRIFDRGFTGTHGRKVSSSTGMGLYLAARICQKMGLGLSVSSTEGDGTVIDIVFPQDTRAMELQSDMDERLP